MQYTLRKNEYNGKDIELIDGNKSLIIMFGGTGDLYWIIKNKGALKDKEYNYDNFVITKENYPLYSTFKKLITDIKEINIYDNPDFPPYIETEEEKEEYLYEQELDKKRYKMFNMSNYNNLYNQKENKVTWVSDETGFEVANKVQISNLDDEILIEFCTQSYIEGYEREDNLAGIMGIRFRNSGSRYEPFNYVFMRMYQELQQLDDVKDECHQIHIEEYLFSKKKKIKE